MGKAISFKSFSLFIRGHNKSEKRITRTFQINIFDAIQKILRIQKQIGQANRIRTNQLHIDWQIEIVVYQGLRIDVQRAKTFSLKIEDEHKVGSGAEGAFSEMINRNYLDHRVC